MRIRISDLTHREAAAFVLDEVWKLLALGRDCKIGVITRGNADTRACIDDIIASLRPPLSKHVTFNSSNRVFSVGKNSVIYLTDDMNRFRGMNFEWVWFTTGNSRDSWLIQRGDERIILSRSEQK